MKHFARITASLLSTLLLVVPSSRADFDAGLKAYTQLYEYHRAYREFLSEALNGHREAQFYLGEICEGGVGRPINHEEAFRWYLDSAQQGYGPAQQRLANLYFHGRGVKRNLPKAFKWQKKSAEQGQVIAQYRLGHYYAEGIGTDKENVLAYMWWSIAASLGDPDAMPELMKLAGTLSASEIEKGEAQARQWEKDFHAGEYGRQASPSKKTDLMK